MKATYLGGEMQESRFINVQARRQIRRGYDWNLRRTYCKVIICHIYQHIHKKSNKLDILADDKISHHWQILSNWNLGMKTGFPAFHFCFQRHTGHFWHHPSAPPAVWVWKVEAHHLLLNIIPINLTVGTGRKRWFHRGINYLTFWWHELVLYQLGLNDPHTGSLRQDCSPPRSLPKITLNYY